MIVKNKLLLYYSTGMWGLLINAASIILTITKSGARSEMLSYKPNQTKPSQNRNMSLF